MLNMTGCESITVKGLKALIHGLKYVQMGVSFLGFRPIDDHVDKKLTDHVKMIRDSAIDIIREGLDKRRKKEQMKQEHMDFLRERAAHCIQGCWARYLKRMPFYRMWRERIQRESTLLIQRIWRGSRGRVKRDKRKSDLAAFLALTPYALMMQKVVRGHVTRMNSGKVFEALREMYELRNREAEVCCVYASVCVSCVHMYECVYVCFCVHMYECACVCL